MNTFLVIAVLVYCISLIAVVIVNHVFIVDESYSATWTMDLLALIPFINTLVAVTLVGALIITAIEAMLNKFRGLDNDND